MKIQETEEYIIVKRICEMTNKKALKKLLKEFAILIVLGYVAAYSFIMLSFKLLSWKEMW